ncbi:MAG: UbiA family prenyltransferase [Archangium sp.]|nr:UbiA family prenyltransferase [Archangium sp.]
MKVPGLERLFRAAERRKWTLALALATPGWIAVVRMLLERELSVAPSSAPRPPFPWFAHIYVFYLALAVCLTALLARVTKQDWKVASGPVSMGLTLGTVPPLIDVAVYGMGRFSYEYSPAVREFPWSLHLPPNVLPAGETTVLWLTIALMTLAGLRSEGSMAVRVVRGAVLAISTWALVVVFLVALPAASQWLSLNFGVAPSEWRNTLFAVVLFAFAVWGTGTGTRLLERTLHVLLAPLIVLLGAAVRGPLESSLALALIHFALLSAGFVLANDFYDRAEDEASGRGAPLEEESAQWLAVVALVPVMHLLAFRIELGLCLLGFAIVSYAYHADPLRLKCVFPLSYKTEGFLGGLSFFAGLTMTQPAFLNPTQLWAAALVTVGTPAALVFKDWKDVDGDAKANVHTAFVVLERRGWARLSVARLSAGLLALSFGVVAFGVTRFIVPNVTQWVVLLVPATAGVVVLVSGTSSPKRSVFVAMACAELALFGAAWALLSR